MLIYSVEFEDLRQEDNDLLIFVHDPDIVAL